MNVESIREVEAERQRRWRRIVAFTVVIVVVVGRLELYRSEWQDGFDHSGGQGCFLVRRCFRTFKRGSRRSGERKRESWRFLERKKRSARHTSSGGL